MKVFSNNAVSLDGRINTREGRFTSLGSAHDLVRMSELRAQADAVLVGGATFRRWPNPSLVEPPVPAPPGHRPWNVVVTRALDVPLERAFLTDARVRPLFITRAAAFERPEARDVRDAFPDAFEAWPGGDEDLPIGWIVDVLRRRGVERVLVEAGGDLVFQFLAADALDEMHVTLCPLVIGGRTPSLAGGTGFTFDEMRRLRLLDAKQVGDELFLHYRVSRTEPR
ncbi:RibD family protein [Piscinibacter koreensis]|uniref:Dihydrofolate reductase family protein n=1 Tax=Piscinibacter koreensis TaxID=2742824 RepID=A0A7Y6NR80_9BURK|nr:dihydrofolate reductase family protein [Schlegelella koreensis]NUZ07846.1 dihydrofolate reductase family protein [Schlegelella koreensis]